MTTSYFQHTGFFDLIADSIFHWRAADAIVPTENMPAGLASYRMNRHARASIVASMLSFESAANCLISALDMPNKMKEDLDKLSGMGKYELYARIKHGVDVPRADIRAAKVLELVRARNEFVHPKTKALNLNVEEVTDGGKDWVLGVSLSGERWNSLDIPKNAMFWSATDAATAIHATSKFMGWYFSQLLSVKPSDVSKLLFSTIKFEGMETNGIPEEFFDELRTTSDIFDFSFFHVLEPMELERQIVLNNAQR